MARLFGGDAATVDLLGKLRMEAAIKNNGSAAARETYSTAYSAYIAAAPDSPMARADSAANLPVPSNPWSGYWDADGFYHSH